MRNGKVFLHVWELTQQGMGEGSSHRTFTFVRNTTAEWEGNLEYP